MTEKENPYAGMSPSDAALVNQLAEDELVDEIDLLSDDRG